MEEGFDVSKSPSQALSLLSQPTDQDIPLSNFNTIPVYLLLPALMIID